MSFDQLLKKHYVKILVAILVVIVVVGVAYYYKKEKYIYDSDTDSTHYDNMQTAYGSLPKLTIIYNPESLVGVHDDILRGNALDTIPFVILIAISLIQVRLGKRVHSRVIATSDTSRIPKGYNGVVRIIDSAIGKREDIPFGKTPAYFTNDLVHIHKRINKMPKSSLNRDEVNSLPIFSIYLNYANASLNKKTKNKLPGILVNAANHMQDVLGMCMLGGAPGSENLVSLRIGEDNKTYSLGTDISSLKDTIKYVISHEIRSDIH